MDISTNSLLLAFSLTLFAGLSTCVGSAITFFTKHTNTRFLSIALGFSAGVMIYISFVEIFSKARESLIGVLGVRNGTWATVLSFFGGVALIAIIDRLIPSFENPHEMRTVEEATSGPEQLTNNNSKMRRMGLLTVLAVAIHNFPEGLATFTSALVDPALGLSIAVAIAIHNIPEGIAISVPVYYATKSRKKAFTYSFISGLAEPAGAIIGYLLFRQFFNDMTFGLLFGTVAGIMVFISLDELLPAAQKYGEHHAAIYGLVAGMAVMAVSLLMFL